MSDSTAAIQSPTPQEVNLKKERSVTASAVYAQHKRDEEALALKTLLKKLTEKNKQPIPSDIDSRSDMNPTTRAICAALRIFKSDVSLPAFIPKEAEDKNSKKNNRNRRKHEKVILSTARQTLPTDLLQQQFMFQTNFNDATKILLACVKNLQFLETGHWCTTVVEDAAESAVAGLNNLETENLEDIETLLEEDIAKGEASTFLIDLLKESAAMVKPQKTQKRELEETPDTDDEVISPLASVKGDKIRSVGLDSSGVITSIELNEILEGSTNTTTIKPPIKKIRTASKDVGQSSKSKGKPKAVPQSSYQVADWVAVNYNPDGKTHSCEHVRVIEQAAKSLIQKTRESVSPTGTAYTDDTRDLTPDDLDHLEFTQGILVDLIEMIQAGVKRKTIRTNLEQQLKFWEAAIKEKTTGQP